MLSHYLLITVIAGISHSIISFWNLQRDTGGLTFNIPYAINHCREGRKGEGKRREILAELMKQYSIVLADHWLESRVSVGLDHLGITLENSIKQNELWQSTDNPNLMKEILLVSIKDHGALLWTDMYLISNSHQITVYQDMQPPLITTSNTFASKNQKSLRSPRTGTVF